MPRRVLAVLIIVLAIASALAWLTNSAPAKPVRPPSDLAYLPETVLDAVKERFENGELGGPVELEEAKTTRDGRYTRYRLRAFATVQGRRFRAWTTVIYDRQRNVVLGWIDQ